MEQALTNGAAGAAPSTLELLLAAESGRCVRKSEHAHRAI